MIIASELASLPSPAEDDKGTFVPNPSDDDDSRVVAECPVAIGAGERGLKRCGGGSGVGVGEPEEQTDSGVPTLLMEAGPAGLGVFSRLEKKNNFLL